MCCPLWKQSQIQIERKTLANVEELGDTIFKLIEIVHIFLS